MSQERPRTLKYVDQAVFTYAHLPKINHPSGERKIVDDPDLWFASKINATLKKSSASDVYWEKRQLPDEQRARFITGVRNHSWNRQHMGAMVVSGIDFETEVSSLVSNVFVLGKFYRMQQQTRRSVILDEVIKSPEIDIRIDVQESYRERFELYWEICDKRPEKFKGFDPYIQDAFKILPLSTKTRFSGNLDLRSAKGYSRWRNYEYLPNAVRDFAQRLHNSLSEEYPIMYQSYLYEDQSKLDKEIKPLLLGMAKRIGSNDMIDEPLLWYSDHSFLLRKNKFFEQVYDNFNLAERFEDAGPDAMFLGYFNPLGIELNDIKDLFETKDEGIKSATEMTLVAFISKIDISGGIDTWRHTRVNRIVQPIYHALENSPKIALPELYRRQAESGRSDIPDKVMELSTKSIELYHQLVKDGVSQKEAINVLPHNLELIQIEIMDIFSFLNIMAIRTCIHARPDVQIWAKSLLRELATTPDFKGIDDLSEDKSSLLARGIVFKYCMELGTCTKCGKDIIYLPDPYRST